MLVLLSPLSPQNKTISCLRLVNNSVFIFLFCFPNLPLLSVSLSFFQPLIFSFHAFYVFNSIFYQVRSPLPIAYKTIFFLTEEVVQLHLPKTHLFW